MRAENALSMQRNKRLDYRAVLSMGMTATSKELKGNHSEVLVSASAVLGGGELTSLSFASRAASAL
jgi:azurin